MTSPPVVVNGLVVTVRRSPTTAARTPASGEVRAYDARTGALKWTWDPIPQDRRIPPTASGAARSAHKTGGANAWSVLAADPARDLVFVPTGSAAPDYYGALRLGDNRYANSIVALQSVHRPRGVVIPDRASRSVGLRQRIAAGARHPDARTARESPRSLQATKNGMLFVLNRETGVPVFPVEERRCRRATFRWRRRRRTQPFTAGDAAAQPASLHRRRRVGNDRGRSRRLPRRDRGLRNEGIFTPPSVQGRSSCRRTSAARTGAASPSTRRQIAIVPVNRIAAMVQLIPREASILQQARAKERAPRATTTSTT